MAAVGKPLRLKDLLELDCDSCSAAGFRCYPRHLCVAVPLPARHEAPEAHSVFGRSHSLLSIRSLSRRLRGSFSWGRRDEEAPAPVPAVSSCSSSDSETSVSGSSAAESDFSSACSAESRSTGVTAAADGHEQEAMESGSKEEGSGSEADDKEQLSPVAVMDFPFHDDDEDDAVEDGGTSDGGSACSSSPFGDSLAQLHQRRNIQLKHKLRRLRSIGVAPAVDLGDHFAAASEPDGVGSVPLQHRCPESDAAKPASRLEGHRSVHVHPDEDNLIAQLTSSFSAGNGSERLLLDFFAETRRLSNTTESCEAAVRVAQDWVQGAGERWGLKEALCGREDLLAEMDRGRRWSSRVGQEEEEREVGVLVARLVVDDLLCELVNDMLL
ncbi:uncharacterized protein LOC124647651 [Lolium rigidum]|uniref:uncharacterized protein LOC124647651 n=1 Tax=Lolium rigidum TaxID=89674 RepID=UPI001F5E0749|nr:uncharacterized protein LOC124647651 [Lolium rigidum]